MARLDELFLPPPPANVLQWQVSAQASASLIEALETIIATAEQNILTVGPDPALAPVRAELGKIVDAIAASDGRGEAVDTDELLDGDTVSDADVEAVAWPPTHPPTPPSRPRGRPVRHPPPHPPPVLLLSHRVAWGGPRGRAGQQVGSLSKRRLTNPPPPPGSTTATAAGE